MDTRRFTIRYWSAAAGMVAAWMGLAYVFVPRLVRRAYAGRSIDAFNRLISGRSEQGVESYLALWSSIASRLTLALLAVLVLVYGIWLFRTPIRRGLDRLLLPEPLISRGQALLISSWLGLGLGLVEVSARFAKFQFVGAFSRWSNPDTVWMAPLANGALFLAIGALILALGTWRRRVGIAPFVLVLVGLGAYGVIRVLELGVHPVAAAVLAIGVAVQATRWAGRRSAGLVSLARRSTLPAVMTLGGIAIAMNPGALLVERLRLGRLADTEVPNVLLVVWDTVRSQNLSLYGYARPTTPVLEGLAHQSVVFDHAIATSPWTLPSHGSLFTGRHHHELSTDFETPLDDTYPTLAEALRERGYATGAFVANLLYATRASGLDRGFIRYEDYPVSPRVLLWSSWLTQQLADWVYRRVPGRRATFVRKYAPDVNRETLQWLDGLGQRPFFAFLNYFDAHLPYEHYDEYVVRFPDEPPRDSVFVAPGQFRRYQPGALRVIEAYDSSIALMDDYLGRLLAALEERGLRQNTLVIVTSDHGEQLGEHGLTDHANSLYMPVLKVPLLISMPGTLPAGVRIQDWVTNRSVPATILEIIDGEPDATWPGVSLVPYWSDNHDAEKSRWQPLLSEVNPNPFAAEAPGRTHMGPMKSLIQEGVHYIRNGDGSEEVYDLAVDPWEREDLASRPAGEVVLPGFRSSLVRALGQDPEHERTGDERPSAAPRH